VSEDEVFALALSAVLALIGMVRWYKPLLTVSLLGGGGLQRVVLFLAPPLGLAVLWRVLTTYAAREVREGPEYVLLFMLAGAAWMGLAAAGMRAVGVSFRDDAIENRNPAAVAVACGAIWAAMLCFAGSNAGEGETIWTTFFPAAVATALLWLLWFVLACVSSVVEAVTIDRDISSGLRLAGLLIAGGLVLGRAGAGDCLADMVQIGWPAGTLTLVALIAQVWLRPTPRRPRGNVWMSGVVPAAGFIGAAAGYVLWLGYRGYTG
jgi:hypothetical protein